LVTKTDSPIAVYWHWVEPATLFGPFRRRY